MLLLDLLAALAAGALTGAGVGGGSLLLLYLLQVRQIEQLTAQGINLLYYVAAASPSLLFHLRHGLVEPLPCVWAYLAVQPELFWPGGSSPSCCAACSVF